MDFFLNEIVKHDWSATILKQHNRKTAYRFYLKYSDITYWLWAWRKSDWCLFCHLRHRGTQPEYRQPALHHTQWFHCQQRYKCSPPHPDLVKKKMWGKKKIRDGHLKWFLRSIEPLINCDIVMYEKHIKVYSSGGRRSLFLIYWTHLPQVVASFLPKWLFFCQRLLSSPSFLATATSFFSSTRPNPMSSSWRSPRTWAAIYNTEVRGGVWEGVGGGVIGMRKGMAEIKRNLY